MVSGTPRLRIVIVGGSLGGLNSGVWLRDAGFDVEIFERTPEQLEGRGTGIVLHPATIRYLRDHNALNLEEISTAVNEVRYIAPDGRVLHTEDCPYRFTAYNEIYRGLLSQFDADRYHLDCECVAFEQDNEHATVYFADGSSVTCDLVVFADGINSVGRRELLPDARPTYSGYVAWRGTIPESRLTPATQSLLNEAIAYAPTADSHILSYPIPQHDSHADRQILTNWLWYRNVFAGEALNDLLTSNTGEQFRASVPPGFVQERHLDQLRQDANALPAPMKELVNDTEAPFLQVILDLVVDRMVFGRACILGDGAFTARPHAAAGTAKAAEDAWQLAQALTAHHGQLAPALAAWEKAQLKLGHSLVARGREAGDKLQSGSWEVTDPLPFGLYTIGDNRIE